MRSSEIEIIDSICSKTRMVGGPLGDYLGQFRSRLENQRYSQASIIKYTRCIAALDQLMRKSGVDVKDMDEERAMDLVTRSNRPSYWKKKLTALAGFSSNS